jgi:4-oxalocrotonate tautomerase
MPLVNVKLIEGVFTSEQKQRIVRDLTNAMVTIEGENMRPVTWVVVEEVRSGDWGIGGNPLSTADVKALAALTAHRRKHSGPVVVRPGTATRAAVSYPRGGSVELTS